MASGESQPRQHEWQRLLALLEPIHAQAAGTARRLARSADDGDDLFQEAVLRALAALPSLRDPSRFRSWFYAILISVHRNRARRAFWKRFVPLELGWNPDREPAGEDGGDWEDDRQRAARVSRALAGLPPVQREAVVLFEIEGFGIEEIAAFQQVSSSAVKSRLARGRARLRRIYERWGLGLKGANARGTAAPVIMAPAPGARSAGGGAP